MPADPGELYLDLLRRTLTRFDFGDERYAMRARSQLANQALRLVASGTRRCGVELDRVRPFDPEARREGRDQPPNAETMVGLKRLCNIESCIRTIVREAIPGDLLEAGVWRGGAAIFMRAVLEVLGDTERNVWAADSFQGLPRPNPGILADRGDRHHQNRLLAVSLEEVQANFRRYGWLDERVKFLPGWFEDTLPDAPVESLALLRADADMYSSTISILDNLYWKVSAGGFVIIDDYGNSNIPACRRAVEDFRARHSITSPVEMIDWTGAFWRKDS